MRLLCLLLLCWAESVLAIEYQHGTSYIEPLKYPPGFTHFAYTNPDAPKGGTIRFPELGTFDSFNNMIDKGRVPEGYNFLGVRNLVYDRLLEPAIDENASFYGRLADGVWIADDYRQVAFRLRKGAYWHDGVPITAADVIFTFETYQKVGSAGIRTALLELEKIEQIGEREVLFTVKASAEANPTLPFAIGTFPILPKHYWESRDITKTTLEPPLGSGPYKMGEMSLGRYLILQRVDSYWGKDIAVNKGRYNFDRIKCDYFRDEDIMLEAVKGDVIDIRNESVSKAWVTEYEFPAVKAGYFKKDLIHLDRPWGMWWPILWNLDRERFQDIRVREALWLLYDFPWENRVILFGFYKQADSFFFNSAMAQSGLPSEDELKLLEPWRGKIPERVFTNEWRAPASSGYGYNRENVKRALALFKQAGWEVKKGRMRNVKTGEQFKIEFIFVSPMLMRSKMPYIDTLNRIGIQTTARSPEVSNWLYRMRNGIFDAGADLYIPGNTPGLALRNRYSTAAANQPYAQNWARIRNPAVDSLIDRVLAARKTDEFYAATRALDRVLLWNFYFLPGQAQPGYRLVYWDKFGQPLLQAPLQRPAWLDTWWWDPEKADRIHEGMRNLMDKR